jgi:hypothetical protein
VIGPTAEVSAGTLEDTLVTFYKVVIETGSLGRALENLDDGYKHFICAEWFYSTFASYLVHHFTAKDRLGLVEDIVSSEVAKAGYSNRELIRAARKKAQQLLRTPHTMFRHFCSRFLHGRLEISYEEFDSYVKSQKAK